VCSGSSPKARTDVGVGRAGGGGRGVSGAIEKKGSRSAEAHYKQEKKCECSMSIMCMYDYT
jgi:hypothetical protein